MKTKYLIILFSLVFLTQLMLVSADNMYIKNYSVSGKNTQFAVQTLKYEPYPVNAGDWFDVWIEVQNTGQEDAKNVNFQLVSNYPFSLDDNSRQFNVFYGSTSAYAMDMHGDANTVVLKYRVKVADNAPDGTSNLKMIVSVNNKDPSSQNTEYTLPIEIKKTKTDFDVKIHDITPQETSFVITNIGDNTAKAVSVDLKNQGGAAFLSGNEPASLGDINSGDFTIAHMKIVPQKNAKELTLEISYTDNSGVRTTIEKNIQMENVNLSNICVQGPDKGYMNWVYGAIGLLTGAFIVILTRLFLQKRASKHKIK
ncbi:Uncharacterised protein [uncultured archaeon]|nr:Uncharacterised protein [uncultured archaeon]